MVSRHAVLFYAVLANLVLIIYGSLLPFEVRPRTLAESWDIFRQISYLELGLASRADWIANIVLYVPFAFFADGWLSCRSGLFGRRVVRNVIVLATAAIVALAVEFVQIWIAPRTVSLNDISAEIIGAMIGVAAWEFTGERLIALAGRIPAGGAAAVQSVAAFYVIAYIALSNFPYDFTASSSGLAAKMESTRAHWFLFKCAREYLCVFKEAAEVLAAMPIGALMEMRFRHDRRWTLSTAFFAGLALGVSIEVCQFFLVSGVSQGMSVLTRGVGLVLGVIIYRRFRWYYLDKIVPYLRFMIVVGVVPYMLALTTMNGWFSGQWVSWGVAKSRLTDVHFLPFYYHYYAAEAVALVSLIYQFSIYLPVGAAVWLWQWAGGVNHTRTLFPPIAVAVVTACLIEFGKLFNLSEHPDPTNVVIAAVAAVSAYVPLQFFSRYHHPAQPSNGIYPP